MSYPIILFIPGKQGYAQDVSTTTTQWFAWSLTYWRLGHYYNQRVDVIDPYRLPKAWLIKKLHYLGLNREGIRVWRAGTPGHMGRYFRDPEIIMLKQGQWIALSRDLTNHLNITP